MEKTVEIEVIEKVLKLYGFDTAITGQKSYFHAVEENGWLKLIFRVTLANGKQLVIKILHEDDDLTAEMKKVENQSVFSELMRNNGIKTPARYQAMGKYCNEFTYHELPCMVTVEEWCGEEITEITTDIAYQIGKLMARMHQISLQNKSEIGYGTLFSAAYWNDVDSFPEFCEITKDEKLDQELVAQIKALRDQKLERIRSAWETHPKAAVVMKYPYRKSKRTENTKLLSLAR